MSQPPLSHLRRRLHFRLRNAPNKEMRFLEDDQGWLYIERLMGSRDFGPYMKEELLEMFDIEPEPWRVTEIVRRTTGDSSSDGSDQG
jgi:hypothetical protein